MNEIFQYFKFKKLSKNWEKKGFLYAKWSFERIENSAHTTGFLNLEKTLNVYIDYLMFSQADNM